MPTSSYRSTARCCFLFAFLAAMAGSSFAQQFSSSNRSAVPSAPQVSASDPTWMAESLAEAEPFGSAPDAEIASVVSAPVPVASPSMAAIAYVPVTVQPRTISEHRFWDRNNKILFATVGGLAAADFYATHANLASGGKELNPVTRVFAGSTPALATNFVLETGSVVGVSYLLHRTGHHKLERISALVNIGISGASVGYSFSHH